MEECSMARQCIARLDDTELKELIKLASKETGAEGKVIFYLLLSEYEHRKEKSLMTKFND